MFHLVEQFNHDPVLGLLHWINVVEQVRLWVHFIKIISNDEAFENQLAFDLNARHLAERVESKVPLRLRLQVDVDYFIANQRRQLLVCRHKLKKKPRKM